MSVLDREQHELRKTKVEIILPVEGWYSEEVIPKRSPTSPLPKTVKPATGHHTGAYPNYIGLLEFDRKVCKIGTGIYELSLVSRDRMLFSIENSKKYVHQKSK